MFQNLKVRFSNTVQKRCMRTWAFAHRLARIGNWEQSGRDRCRFFDRITKTGAVVGLILDSEHRQRVYTERFINSN